MSTSVISYNMIIAVIQPIHHSASYLTSCWVLMVATHLRKRGVLWQTPCKSADYVLGVFTVFLFDTLEVQWNL